jgi:CRISPR-associated protein Cas1
MRRTTSVETPVAHLVGPGKLAVINRHLAFRPRDGKPVRLDPSALTQIVCYGDVGVTGEALALLLGRPVAVAWMTPAGNRCRGRVVRCDPTTTGTRLRQHRALARPDACREWAREVVAAKVATQADAARHLQRHGCGGSADVLKRLRRAGEQAQTAASLESLRGVEGAASAAWFELLGRALRPPWRFPGRVRRPPTDPVNALLSLGYTWLLNRAIAAAEAAGLEVYLGGLHDYRPGRPSLACDLIEPLRVPAVDRWVIAGCNQEAWSPKDFRQEGAGIRLQPDSFGRILTRWEQHWTDGALDGSLTRWVERIVTLVRRWAPENAAPEEEAAL